MVELSGSWESIIIVIFILHVYLLRVRSHVGWGGCSQEIVKIINKGFGTNCLSFTFLFQD